MSPFSPAALHVPLPLHACMPIRQACLTKLAKDATSLITRAVAVAALSKYEGHTLELSGVQRQEMGNYLCIASNGIPPSVSKRYSVQVQCECGPFDFPPT